MSCTRCCIQEANISDQTVFISLHFRYLDIQVGSPEVQDGCIVNRSTTPHECRLRDLNYSASIAVDIEYVRNNQRIIRKNMVIGK